MLYGKGRRNFKQEQLIEHFKKRGKVEHFSSENRVGTHQDINVKIIVFCDPNDQEKREKFLDE